MSSSPDTENRANRAGYTKLVNVQGSGGQQRVSVFIPDTRRKRSPEAEARALARAEIKEAYKSAALAEEVKAIKKQRNKLVDNLAKVGKTPSSVLSGTPTSYVSPTSVLSTEKADELVGTTPIVGPETKSGTKAFNNRIDYTASIGPETKSGTKAFNNRIDYTAPIGPETKSGTKAFNNRMNYSAPIGPTQGPGLGMSFNRNRDYSAPIGPLPSQSMGGFQDRPFNNRMNYSAPIGPTQGPGMGMSFNRNRDYSAPIGPLPSQSMGGFQDRPFNNRMNYSAPIGPAQGPGMGMSFNRNRDYSAPIGPLPSQGMGGFQNRPFNNRMNYSVPAGPAQGPGMGMSFNRNRDYNAPIGPLPSQDMGGFQNRPFNNRMNYSAPAGPATRSGTRPSRMSQQNNYDNGNAEGPATRSGPRPSRMSQQNNYDNGNVEGPVTQSGTRPSRMSQQNDYNNDNVEGPVTQSGTRPSRIVQGPVTRSGTLPEVGKGRLWERALGQAYKPGMNIIFVVKALRKKKQRSPTKAKSFDAAIADAKSDPRLSITALNLKPEQLLPGKTLQEVEALYKRKKAKAIAAGKMQFVTALDRAIIIRRKQFGATPQMSSQKSSQKPSGFTPTGKTPPPSTPERNAEFLLPGKTEEAVKKIYSNRKAAALKKGDKALADRLDRALPVRLQRIKSQGANVMKVPPERLLPGTTLEGVEKTYKERRAMAQQKKRAALVAALDRAIIVRRKQLGGKSPSPSMARSPTGKTPSPSTPERNAEVLLPAKTEEAVKKVHAERKAAALKKGDKALADRLNRALPVRLQRIKSQGANVMKVPPERLLPGSTFADVEKTYKERRAVAQQKKRAALVTALDRAIIVRRKQFGGKSPSPSAKTDRLPSPVPTKTGKKFQSVRNVPPEMLLPGKTLENVNRAYKQKRSAAVAKKRTDYVQALNKAYVTRKSQVGGKSPSPVPTKTGKKFQSVRNVPPEMLLPGKTLENVDKAYKQKRSAAVAKKRTDYVQALNKAYVTRKSQVGGKSPSPSPSVKPSKKFQSVRDVPPAVLLPGKTLENVDREYKKRKSAAVAKKRVELSQALNKAYAIRKTQVSSKALSSKIEEDKKKRESEIARQKKIELEKKKSIDARIIQTKRKLQSVGSSAKKAMANVEKFQKEIAVATQRRDTAKVAKFSRAAEKRKQNLGRARTAQQQIASQLSQLERMKANPSAMASSVLSPLKSSKMPSPKLPSPSIKTPSQKMPSPKMPSPKIDEQKRRQMEQKRKFEAQKKQQIDQQRKMQQKRKIQQQQKMRKPAPRMIKRRR
ncbi:hypothetical protein FR483_N020L [Paramecium bursaria Chlorella virus FR483]|uniref:Uncharacterized protein N020L n=1 Tax=Paramecium bursaria Chlorella virus FR483 TaxID=399781 RepID=A7J674_PBCVF|nr:hypothetical protein FR483_N020L [Paramecium bursaria Chlorella virus FR483]ABT15305.1 hypothetical protein FR483_N020L [Paramecium bursaria Chlorella virus FR483]